ncbi:hypothetical protein [Dyella sp. SG609]|uniref:hypothetical protein n=1 Tax=Dyella sp. SG609 TaxID=2587018 RepID=UPI0014454347|nr:hypothetical protein [Dyella sp. SG609]NKJ20276.1 hypothetical protein [Dyella sp. SG609]
MPPDAAPTGLTQAEVELLLQIEHGQIERGQIEHGQIERGQIEHGQIEHGQIEHSQIEQDSPLILASAPAASLLMRGYLMPVPPGHTSYFSYRMVLAGRPLAIQLSYRAHKLLQSIRDGETSRWPCRVPPRR